MAAATTEPALGHVGAYDVLATLGQGGMAKTYLAVRHGPGGFEQRVCLKRIRSEHHEDPEFVRQFLAEARIAASVSHASLVKVLDFGQDAEGYFMALELVPGLDLCGLHAELKQRGQRLPADIVVYIASELAAALEVLHRASLDGEHRGLVHRDVSPSNVLLSYDGEVKLADFGIARPVDGPKHTQTGIIKGKVPYMAPSYARTAKADVRCDLFAVGVVLFEVIAGRRPYQGATDLLTLEQAAKGEHPALAELAPDAPRDLVAIVERLIEPDPELSYQTASELVTDLSKMPFSAAIVRRELGQLIEGVRPRRGSVFQLRGTPSTPPPSHEPTEPLSAMPPIPVAGPNDVTQPLPAVSPVTSASATVSPTRSLRVWIAIAATVALTAVAALALRNGEGPGAEQPPSTALMNEVAAQEDAPTTAPRLIRGQPEPSPTEPDHVPPADNDPRVEVSQRGTLHVVVVPFGEIIVDGKPRGRDRVTVRLPAGTHEVVAVRQGAQTKRQVQLKAGETRRVVID